MAKKLISIALCLVMLLSVLPVGVSAKPGDEQPEKHSPVKGYVEADGGHRKACSVQGCTTDHSGDGGYDYHEASEWKAWVGKDGDTHTRECRHKHCTVVQSGDHDPVWHTTGEKHSQICSVCDYVIVKEAAHEGEWQKDGENHYRDCECGKHEEASHNYTNWVPVDGTNKHRGTCDVCYATTEAEHTYYRQERDNDSEQHSVKCDTCGLDIAEDHSFAWEVNGNQHVYKCSGCGFVASTHDPVTPEKWTSDGENHKKVCQVEGCPFVLASEKHNYQREIGVNTHWEVCGVCQNKINEEAHEFGEWTLGADGKHVGKCKCGATESHDADMSDWTLDGENHKKVCQVEGCTFEESGAHTYQPERGDTTHWEECGVCHNKINEEAHKFGAWTLKDGKHVRTCDCGDCGYSEEHVAQMPENWTPDGENHKKVCQVEGCTIEESEAHKPEQKSDNAQHWNQCTECSVQIGEKEAHKFTPWTEVDKKEHSRKCTVCEFTQTEKHVFAQNPYICDDCDYAEQGHESYKMNEVTPKWEAGSGVGAKFRSSAEFKAFVTVLLDGTELSSGDYTVYSGSTVVVLQPELLDTLEVGEHTISIVSYTSTGKMAVSAKFTIVRGAEEHLVVFKMNGHGNRIHPQVVKDGECVEQPHNPKEKGYIFCGWYTDRHLHHKFSFRTPITEDTVLYAKWIKASPVPKTGDNSNTALWASVLVAGLAITGMALIPQNKKIGK